MLIMEPFVINMCTVQHHHLLTAPDLPHASNTAQESCKLKKKAGPSFEALRNTHHKMQCQIPEDLNILHIKCLPPFQKICVSDIPFAADSSEHHKQTKTTGFCYLTLACITCN